MEGTWYVTDGFNPYYDCFGCQELSFDFKKGQPVDYNALYNLIAVNGSIIWNDIKMKGTEETPGIITMRGRDSGFENVQTWYFMMVEADTSVVYYCGDLESWHFEGILVMSKTPEFNAARKG